MRRAPRRGRWFGLIALLSFGAVGIALVSQYAFDMQPCPWCVLERAIFVAIGVVCAVGLALRNAAVTVVASALALLLAIAGIASALWQHFQAAASASCNLTLADRIVSGTLHLDRVLPGVFEARASCADAAVSLFGVPYDFWALGTYAVIAALLFAGLGRGDKPGQTRL